MTVPKGRLPVALCIADEWENQTAVLKPHTLPMVRNQSWSYREFDAETDAREGNTGAQTSITSRALDGLQNPDMRKDVVAYLLRYLDTDTVWCAHSLSSRTEARQPTPEG